MLGSNLVPQLISRLQRQEKQRQSSSGSYQFLETVFVQCSAVRIMSRVEQRYAVTGFDSTSRNNSNSFGISDNKFGYFSNMAARPNNNNSGSGSSSNDRPSWMSSNDSSKSSSMSSSSSSSMYKNVADNVMNSWFFRNQNSPSGGSNPGSGNKFKADMNLWMPQSM